ncbi:MAG: adenylosuccinate lyase [Candidatus Eremiobacteraeota bacterium]|nr:adenylosuccinate lyase [Candidatus Eremiobacteraeota bacterium]
MTNDRTYASPFSWRYGSAEMRELFSERERRRLWRAVWIALARSQAESGLVTSEELADLEAHRDDVDLDAALAIEREIGHDLMAEIRVFASQAPLGGKKLHLGATSMDVEDTVETYRLRCALSRIGAAVGELLESFAALIDRYADLVTMGHTHLQFAEPTTLGYRFAAYAQDVLIDDAQLRTAYEALTAKGIRGAVGTSASYERLLRGSGRRAREQEAEVLAAFGLQARDVSTQTYPRKLDYLVLSSLAGLGASLSKFAADVRLLASPGFGEVFEPFGAKQVGSSAMPFKRNPVRCERIGSLARLLPGYADTAWQNAATNYLERTLDDSANRRTILPEAFLCSEEIVSLAASVVRGLRVDERRIAQNLAAYGAFAGSEALLMEAVKAGGDRQRLHESIRVAAMRAHDRLAQGGDNPLAELLADEASLAKLLDPAEIRSLLDPTGHIGDAPERARALAARIRSLPPFPRAFIIGKAAARGATTSRRAARSVPSATGARGKRAR